MFDFPVFVIEFLCDHIAEDLWDYNVKFFQELDDLEICITWLGEERPQSLDNISAVILVSWRRRRVDFRPIAWCVWKAKFL